MKPSDELHADFNIISLLETKVQKLIDFVFDSNHEDT